MAACPICAGIGGASEGAAEGAAASFEALIGSLGATSSAATNLEGILQKLATSEQAAAAAAGLAASTGYKAADVRRAMAVQAREAADALKALEAAERKAAAAQEASLASAFSFAAAAQKASAAAAQAAAAAQKKDDEGIMASSLRMMGVHDEKLAAQKATAAQTKETSDAFSALTSSGDSMSETLAALNEEFGLAAQGAAAMLAVVGAVAVGVGQLMQKAIGATQAKDSLRTLLGPDVLEAVEGVSEKLPYTVDALGAWANRLKIAGYEGQGLATALQAVGASAALAKDGGAAAEQLLTRLRMTAEAGGKVQLDRRMLSQIAATGVGLGEIAAALGVSIDKLKTMTLSADDLGVALQNALIKKGAGALSQLGQTSAAIWAKVQEGIEDAFEDLGDLVHPFMAEVQLLASEFFKGSVASKTLAGVVRAILEPAFKYATAGVRALHIAFLYVEIYALKARIALAPLIDWLEKTGFTAFMASWGLLALKWVAIGLAVIFGILAVAVFMATLPFLIAIAVILLLVFGIYKLGSAISDASDSIAQGSTSIQASIVSALSGATSALANWPVEAAKAGLNFVLGLVQAITTGQGPVADAARALASSALAALKSAAGFDSHSPSRKAFKIGATVPQGIAGGFDDGAGEVEEAGVNLARSGVKGIAPSGGGKDSNKPSRVFNFYNCTFGGGTTKAMIRDMMAAVLEEEASSGPEPEAEPA